MFPSRKFKYFDFVPVWEENKHPNIRVFLCKSNVIAPCAVPLYLLLCSLHLIFIFFFPVESFKWKWLRLVLKTGTRLNILLWDFFSSPPPFPSKVINWIIYRFHKHNSRLHVHMSMHLYAVMHMHWQENNEDKQNILYAKQWQ